MFLWAVSKMDIQIFLPACLWKVVARVPVGYLYLSASVHCFAWSKISLKFLVQSFFCWFLTCVYHIHWIRVHLYWNFPRVWLQIFSVMYPNSTHVFTSPAGLWKIVVRVAIFFVSHVTINTLIGFKAVPQALQICSCVGKCWPKGHQVSFGSFLDRLWLFVYYSCLWRIVCFYSCLKGHKGALGYSLANFLCYIIRLFVRFSCVWFSLIVGPRGTKDHCNNLVPIFNNNYVKFFWGGWCLKTVVARRFRQT